MTGTNFWVVAHKCPTCGRGETLHVGKTAFQKRFCFQAIHSGMFTIHTKREWIEFIRRNNLEITGDNKNNDDSRVYSLEEFLQIVDGEQRKMSHTIKDPCVPDDMWNLTKDTYYTDADGYNFHTVDFD
jgi:hypothetical protein